ncbi:hypothetical protein KP77_10910 [Jeotgalibacillus alimentarius]|uniref:Uncharacterized protein n=1 Tax=Jeotgalibacillus alimentarius TaxID=135826 RepID=A0A0C2SCA5_9BACL|nr:hypothetical protein [Jeotgalibacillus alimentarius]KIL51579.1 hypothetical protein KP77_10910 [Jeotgalibacillus alimentarius]
MNKKWLLMLTGVFLSAALVGCNAEPDTAEEFEEEVEEPFEDPDNDSVDENDPNPEN